ncbi:Ribonuclease H-like domain [Phytophthora cactorum]|nr:Ribonuclease H-like domain [Phytophthora cactorum]
MPPFSSPTLIYELATYSAMVSINGVICRFLIEELFETQQHPSPEHRQRLTNLMNHLRARHTDYEQVVQSMTADTLVVYACSDKAKTVFGGIEWLVDGEMLLTSVRMHSLEKGEISKRTHSIYALIFDHFVAVFVCYGKEGLATRHLLAFAPLLNDTNQNAPNHKDFIRRTLEYLTIVPRGAVCLIGDNCTTNIATARLFGVPLLGCSSHHRRPSFLPTAAQVKRLEALRKNELSIFQFASIALQEEGTTVADVRAIFDDVIAEIPDTAHHLSSTVAIVKHAPSKMRWSKFNVDNGPTSNSVERLFSTAKRLFSNKRTRLLPKTLEQLLFLRAKRDLWGLGEVAKVVDHVDRRFS